MEKKKRGRPFGATTRPQFYEYTDENDRKEYVKWVRSVYKKKGYTDLAKWYGDQIFGKAPQSLDLTSNGKPLLIGVSNDEA